MSILSPSKNRIRSNQGFTLIEILVAVLILSIGLLGLAALQTASVGNNKYAMQRSQAQMFAFDIIERMRANRDAATAGEYDIAITTTTVTLSAPPLPSEIDLDDWRTSMLLVTTGTVRNAGLPSGISSVATTNVGGEFLVTVTIQWNEKGNAQAFVMETQL